MTAIAINAETIAKLEAAGFKRWTKGNMDRLYVNPECYGVTFDYYKTGNIRDCHFQGERVSNSEGYRFKSTKAYIDIKTGELHVTTKTDFEDEIREAIEAIVAEAVKDEAPLIEAEGIRNSIVSIIRECADSLIGSMTPAEAERARASVELLTSKVVEATPSQILANRELATADAKTVIIAVSRW